MGQRAENIVRAYDVLTKRAAACNCSFNVALFAASLALVGLSIWFALRFADRQVKPLYDLVDAARQVGAGNFAMRVEGRTGADEIGLLNRAFNRMTQQLEKQTQALVGANQQLQRTPRLHRGRARIRDGGDHLHRSGGRSPADEQFGPEAPARSRGRAADRRAAGRDRAADRRAGRGGAAWRASSSTPRAASC
jgi:HAMP domain-containing protein